MWRDTTVYPSGVDVPRTVVWNALVIHEDVVGIQGRHSDDRGASHAIASRCDSRTTDRFTRDIWKRFDERDVSPLRDAILRRRRVLARQA